MLLDLTTGCGRHEKTDLPFSELTLVTFSVTDSVDGLLQSRSSGLISSMRRKVESLNAKRKSRKSLVSLPVHFTPAEDAILTGVASVRMMNSQAGAISGWVERWCQLRPGTLETFRLDTPNVEFSICLDGVSLGLSNDKKHRAALRLTSSDPAVDLLLFEVADKIQMGSWIRGFIQALGIIPTVPYEAIGEYSALAIDFGCDVRLSRAIRLSYDPPLSADVPRPQLCSA